MAVHGSTAPCVPTAHDADGQALRRTNELAIGEVGKLGGGGNFAAARMCGGLVGGCYACVARGVRTLSISGLELEAIFQHVETVFHIQPALLELL